MKKIITSIFLLISSIGYSQESETPIKKDNVIIFEAQNNDLELYNSFTNYLVEAGYVLENENKERLMFQTSYTDMKHLKNYKHLMMFRIKDNRLFITGKWKLNMGIYIGGVSTQNTEIEWYYTPSKSTVHSRQYTEIVEILKGFCNECKMLYKKQ
jgi:hypothetical protein